VDELIAAGAHPQEAARKALGRLAEMKGVQGGILALDTRGRIGAAFNAGRFPVVVSVDGVLQRNFQPVNLNDFPPATPGRGCPSILWPPECTIVDNT